MMGRHSSQFLGQTQPIYIQYARSSEQVPTGIPETAFPPNCCPKLLMYSYMDISVSTGMRYGQLFTPTSCGDGDRAVEWVTEQVTLGNRGLIFRQFVSFFFFFSCRFSVVGLLETNMLKRLGKSRRCNFFIDYLNMMFCLFYYSKTQKNRIMQRNNSDGMLESPCKIQLCS